MATKRATEIPTIDVSLVSIQAKDSQDEYILDTASVIEVEPQVEEQDAIKLIVKGVLKAQKPMTSTLTGNQITLTDNVFTPEIVKILQGGTIHYWANEGHTSEGDVPTEFGISGYTPPVAGSSEKGQTFTLNAYSAQYNAAGEIVQYEKIMYPNCKGVPVAFGSEDDTFRSPEYTINSVPNKEEAPYDIDYVAALPTGDGE